MTSSKPQPEVREKSDELLVYRLVAPKWANSALSGEGARRYGGRWNSPGMSMVYLSGSRALAALELLVHLTTPETRMIPRVLVTVSIPRAFIGGRLWTAPGWQEEPPGKNSTDQGDDWLRSASTAAVRAPSVLVPEEDNLLLNPLHPDFPKVTILESRTFSYDSRFARLSSTLS